MYIKQTKSMLFFLSKSYFFSRNCIKEINATLELQNPIILLHEADLNRGGATLEQMMADCPAEKRAEIFQPDRPVIPWQRIKEFKMVTLKMVVSLMLQHQAGQKKRGGRDAVTILPEPIQPRGKERGSLSFERRGGKVQLRDRKKRDEAELERRGSSVSDSGEQPRKGSIDASAVVAAAPELGSELYVPAAAPASAAPVSGTATGAFAGGLGGWSSRYLGGS